MSHLLWACYIADNIDRFRRLLALTGHSAQAAAVWNANAGLGGGSGGGSAGYGDLDSSPFSTSPRASGGGGKTRKASGFGLGGAGGNAAIGKNEINSRDHAGLTILLRAASSPSKSALAFVQALLEHPAIDIYVQDQESGWNALHRALYAGNISIARLLLDRERRDIAGQTLGSSTTGRVGRLIKTKDHEGNSPFDLYNSTISKSAEALLDDDTESDGEDSEAEEIVVQQNRPLSTGGLQALVDGEDLFFFGSNKNLNLGMGDGDDRQFPERVYLQRPDHLLFRFYDEYIEQTTRHDDAAPRPTDVSELPVTIRNRPLLIHDVVLAKLHSAVLTDDPVSNLYTCGVGRGGRLGLGDENTRFSFEPVQGPFVDKKVVKVALGQSHSMAVTDNGQLWTWGSNTYSQLGYALPPSPKRDEDPMTATPRQVFGPLRKEYILGIAASAHHSVAHTGSSLYCWGKNVGQLALMDADSRSLDVQPVPRKVAASLFPANIVAVSAIDRATTVLLANQTVCVFTSYGYRIVKFDFTETIGRHGRLGNLNMSSRHDAGRSQINYIASGGETIAAVTSRGDLFTMHLTNLPDANQSSSTTNPSKIRDSLTTPQCIWSARKDGVRSVDVGEQGSVIISTHSGAVWRRIKRVKAKDAHVSSRFRSDMKKKDYKFQRVPFISNVVTVRSSAFGAFAAIRSDSDVIRARAGVGAPMFWDDIANLFPLSGLQLSEPEQHHDHTALALGPKEMQMVQRNVGWEAFKMIRSTDLIGDLSQHLAARNLMHRIGDTAPPGVVFCTSFHPDIRIPMHSWIVSARSSVLRDALSQCRKGDGSFDVPELFSAETETRADGHREVVITFYQMDMYSLLNFVMYMYKDKVVPVWNYARQGAALANRYRAVRLEVMKVATRLAMPQLETAARVQTTAKQTMDQDFLQAIKDPRFFEDADTILDLQGAEVPVHSTLLCERCPWFAGLFHGRSQGRWLASRRQGLGPSDRVHIDLKHMDPRAFQYVLEFLYTDSDEELLEGMVAPDMETFIDTVIDVLGIANELMLKRLSQVCQLHIGRLATTRNVSQLLNAVSACSVRDFKESGLRYICMQMETMLENHLLDDLDEDLLRDLDDAVGSNQLREMPYVKAGIAEYKLLETYPELAQEMDEERQRRVREMAFKAAHRDDDRRPSAAGASVLIKGRKGSADDQPSPASAAVSAASAAAAGAHASPSNHRTRKKSRAGSKVELGSPVLRPKASQGDLMFSMEEDEAGASLADSRPRSSRGATVRESTRLDDGGAANATGSFRDEGGRSMSNSPATPVRRPAAAVRGFVKFGNASTTATASPDQQAASSSTPKGTTDSNGNPWGAQTPTSLPRLDLRSIMTETSTSPPFITKTSALSAGLNAQRAAEAAAAAAAAAAEPIIMTPAPKIANTPKMSQKERKKQQQMQQQVQDQARNAPKGPAWDTAQHAPSTTPTPSSAGPSSGAATPATAAAASAAVVPVTDPRVAAMQRKQHHSLRAASPDTRFAGQTRPSPAVAGGSSSSSRSIVAGAATAKPAPAPAPLLPHSKVYIKPAPKAEPVLGLTMADIFLQQQLEQESIKEAVAKRSLQEIQQEQAFQEWWDQESRRAQEEEAERQAKAKGRGGGGGGGGGGSNSNGRSSKKGKAAVTSTKDKAGSAGNGDGGRGASSEAKATPKKTKSARGGGGGGGGGRSRGGGGSGRNGGAPEIAAAGDGPASRRKGGGGGGGSSGRGGKA